MDPWIILFSAVTVGMTIFMGFWSARKSKTAHDFYVAGRSVSVGWNASAISGEYLSAASFMGVAGMVMSVGYDALWYPVCYACGYLFLLLFIAGPLRRFGAYTIPDFAEGRFDSPLFRKIAVIFVLFIGFFYTMPQMKGAGTTLAYIFPGMPYWGGVALVGGVITMNVALGGMKGITLVQAFQYWAKMFAISVPVFVLMAVYGGYGDQLKMNAAESPDNGNLQQALNFEIAYKGPPQWFDKTKWQLEYRVRRFFRLPPSGPPPHGKFSTFAYGPSPTRELTAEGWIEHDTHVPVYQLLETLGMAIEKTVLRAAALHESDPVPFTTNVFNPQQFEIAATNALAAHGIVLVQDGPKVVKAIPAQLAHLAHAKGRRKPLPEVAARDEVWINPFGPLTTKAAKAAGLAPAQQRPYSLLYTYSLIIALVCGTAGLPHILVRFYTNPDGVAAKRTTMWVMILIGVFYVFPPIFGVLGRNLLPTLYLSSGVKGTDSIVLQLPKILNDHVPGLGSILSGVTCAGAFAAFMSTFSGLLVSMTGAMAHDVYGRILRPGATGPQRLKAFKIAAVVLGSIAVLLGSQVERLPINFMVGQAFAIAAASYFPLLFMSIWWRGMTMKGAATGMLTGGLLALACTTLINLSDLGKINLASFWIEHPLLRILAEQPAIWTVPLAIILMVVVSKLTAKDVVPNIQEKMLVLHAPEQLGLRQEYIQETPLQK